MLKSSVIIASVGFLFHSQAAVIQLPPEVNAFKQDTDAELANGQCLVCHSVEYVSTQPPFPRAFWKSSVQKMQQKYGAAIPEDQVEPLIDYLTRNYGSGASGPPLQSARSLPTPAQTSDGRQVAAKYGCLACHNTTTRIVGPSYREIAIKYKSDPAAAAKIDEQIQKGGSGKWGPIIMPPFPQVTRAETRLLIDWILALK
jgi:cytochrome c551/c552